MCDFCNPEMLEWRIANRDDSMYSIVPNHTIREGHMVVVPLRHITKPTELHPNEASSIMREIGRLCDIADQGFGTGVMQKFQPTQPDNGIKVSHLHFHTFPRLPDEDVLFPVPAPNSFDGMVRLSDDKIRERLARFRK